MYAVPLASICRAVAVVPSDAAPIAVTRGLYVGVAGDVQVDFADGGTVLLKGLVAGVVHNLRVTRIYATGTTATNLVALY